MLDFHCHLLVAVDDGPATPEAAFALLDGLKAQGVHELVATPHRFSPRFSHVDEAKIAAAWPILQQQALQLGLTVHLGGENHLSGTMPPLMFAAEAIPLGKSSCVLVELPDDHLPTRTWETMFALQRAKRRPIIAHPERCKGLHHRDEGLLSLLSAGGLLQLTAGNLSGKHGWIMRWRSRRLLNRFPKSCVIASDAHDLGPRRPAFDQLPHHLQQYRCVDLASLQQWAGPGN